MMTAPYHGRDIYEASAIWHLEPEVFSKTLHGLYMTRNRCWDKARTPIRCACRRDLSYPIRQRLCRRVMRVPAAPAWEAPGICRAEAKFFGDVPNARLNS